MNCGYLGQNSAASGVASFSPETYSTVINRRVSLKILNIRKFVNLRKVGQGEAVRVLGPSNPVTKHVHLAILMQS